MMPRLGPPDFDALTPEQQAVYDAIAASPRGAMRSGPMTLWLHSPALAEAGQELGTVCRYRSSLPLRLSELAILVIAAYWRAAYAWGAHARIGREAGLDAGVIEAVRTGRRPDFSRQDEAAVYLFLAELLEARRVSDETYGRAETVLGRTGLVDLVGIAGYYAWVAQTIVAFEIPPDDGSEPFA